MSSSTQDRRQLENNLFKRFLVFCVFVFLSVGAIKWIGQKFASDEIYIEEDGQLPVVGRTANSTKKYFKRVEESGPHDTERVASADEAVKEALKFVDSGDYKLAREKLEAILKENPDHLKAMTELGMVYLIDFREPEQALPLFEKVISADPSNQLVVNELIGVYEELGKQDDGIGFLQSQLEKNPESSSLSLGMGQMMMGQNRTSDAIPYLEKAIQFGNQPDYVYMDLGDSYSKLGQKEKAIEVYRQAVDMADRRVVESTSDQGLRQINEDMLQRNLLNYARELGNSGRYEDATTALQRILQQVPDHQGALAEMKRFQTAKKGG